MQHGQWKVAIPMFQKTLPLGDRLEVDSGTESADSGCSVLKSESGNTSDDVEAPTPASTVWFRQPGSSLTHLVQESGARFIPWCRDGSFIMAAHSHGVGLDVSDKLCQSCLRRAPKAVAHALQAWRK